MAYTFTRTSTTFIAGERAPSAVEAHEGAAIVNRYGNIALHGLEIDSDNRESSIVLDTSTEPPVLRLKNVLASISFGNVNSIGEFVQLTSQPNQMMQKVNGEYSGPDSELLLT
jgi:hypothetical protein